MKEIEVQIGQVKVGRRGELLKATLGSCVGIGFIWRTKNICGLAHCLLPESDKQSFDIGGRFVTQAIPSLQALMKLKPEYHHEIEAIVTGGGNMTSPKTSKDSDLVGTANSQLALALLSETAIKLVHVDVGGNEGRRFLLDCSDFSYRIEKIPRIEKAS